MKKRSIQTTSPSSNGGGYVKYNSNYKGKDLMEAAAEATDQPHEANASKEVIQHLFKSEVPRGKGIKFTHPTTNNTHQNVTI